MIVLFGTGQTKLLTIMKKSIAIIICSLGLLSVSAPRAAAQKVRRPVAGEIESYIDRYAPGREQTNRNGWAHYYIPPGMADTLTVKMSCVYSGMATNAPHTHNEDESFYIIRGPVAIHINGQERTLQTGDFYYTPSGSSHRIARATEADTVKYLVLKRETTAPLAKPFKVCLPGYTIDDCCTLASRDPEWAGSGNARITLLDPAFGDGFGVVAERVASKRKTLRGKADGSQRAIYIISGRAEVTLDGQSAAIRADNTFYSPRGSGYTLRKFGDEPLVMLTITTP
jgi:mannose-6-phosphate isomerase-like protein (cupin superfamily)